MQANTSIPSLKSLQSALKIQKKPLMIALVSSCAYLFSGLGFSTLVNTAYRICGVAGFVGASGNDPFPLTDDEVYEMGVEKREIVVSYAVGDTVRILDGPLSSFTGVVESLEVDKNAVSVIVSMFGRETPVEFELDQIEVISQ